MFLLGFCAMFGIKQHSDSSGNAENKIFISTYSTSAILFH